jgi:uncharacterized protein YwgA
MSSEHYRQAAILAAFVEKVRSSGRDCGETLMQKAAYVMKELFGVPLQDDFRIHYYGPFSFELRDRLSSMEADDIVRLRPREMGVTYEIGRRFDQLRSRFSSDIEAASHAIDFAADRLATLGVKKLEPLTTALYVSRELPGESIDARAHRLREIKEHIGEEEARRAVETIDRWWAETRSVSVH